MLTLDRVAEFEIKLSQIESLCEHSKLAEALDELKLLDEQLKKEIQLDNLSSSEELVAATVRLYETFGIVIKSITLKKEQAAKTLTGQIHTRKKINVYQQIKG